jgi:hypothetical protein
VTDDLRFQDLLPQAKKPALHPAFKPASKKKEVTLDCDIPE